MTDLLQLAIKKYREDGLVALALSAPSYIISNPKTIPKWFIINIMLKDTKPVPTVEQIQQRCRKEGHLWEYDSEHDINEIKAEILPHQTSSVNNDHLFRVRKEGYDWPPRCVCELTDVAVVGKRGNMIDSDGKPVSKLPDPMRPDAAVSRLYWSSIGSSLQELKRQRDISLFREPTRLENAVSMITQRGIYGHWLQDYLPMLLHLSVYEDETGRRRKIIVDKNPPTWMLETLRILGYDEDRIVEWDNGFAVVDRLVLPTASRMGHTPGSTRMSPIEYRWLRERFLESVDGTDTSANERFYISRQNMKNPSGRSGERYVTNFDEIKPILDDFDIEVVRPETMSIEEQVRKFSRGKLFVGPRGSGMHNTLFAKNASTIEIYTPNTRHHIQHLFDRALGHDWTYMIGSEYDKTTEMEEDRNKPFRVNPDVLRTKLEKNTSNEVRRATKNDVD